MTRRGAIEQDRRALELLGIGHAAPEERRREVNRDLIEQAELQALAGHLPRPSR
jgi:hypothetical protein